MNLKKLRPSQIFLIIFTALFTFSMVIYFFTDIIENINLENRVAWSNSFDINFEDGFLNSYGTKAFVVEDKNIVAHADDEFKYTEEQFGQTMTIYPYRVTAYSQENGEEIWSLLMDSYVDDIERINDTYYLIRSAEDTGFKSYKLVNIDTGEVITQSPDDYRYVEILVINNVLYELLVVGGKEGYNPSETKITATLKSVNEDIDINPKVYESDLTTLLPYIEISESHIFFMSSISQDSNNISEIIAVNKENLEVDWVYEVPKELSDVNLERRFFLGESNSRSYAFQFTKDFRSGELIILNSEDGDVIADYEIESFSMFPEVYGDFVVYDDFRRNSILEKLLVLDMRRESIKEIDVESSTDSNDAEVVFLEGPNILHYFSNTYNPNKTVVESIYLDDSTVEKYKFDIENYNDLQLFHSDKLATTMYKSGGIYAVKYIDSVPELYPLDIDEFCDVDSIKVVDQDMIIRCEYDNTVKYFLVDQDLNLKVLYATKMDMYGPGSFDYKDGNLFISFVHREELDDFGIDPKYIFKSISVE